MSHQSDSKGSQAEDSLREEIIGYQRTQVLYVAARLGIADQLSERPVDSATLASRAGAHPESLYRLMRALEVLGAVHEPTPGTFALTDAGELLRSDSSSGLHDDVLMNVDLSWSQWARLEDTIRTGEPTTERVWGTSFFEYLHRSEEHTQRFNRVMKNMVGAMAEAVVDAYDFRPFRRIVDVGGGSGQLLSAVLGAAPEAKGVLFDLPATAGEARNRMDALGLGERCECVGGDFFESVPAGDLIILSGVVGDWNDEQCVQIYTNCRRVIDSGGRLLLLERVLIPEEPAPSTAFLDLHMLVLLGGKGRTAAEFANTLSRAGFELTKVIPTRSERSIVESRPA
jgi:SAM-dependent methyltransferase